MEAPSAFSLAVEPSCPREARTPKNYPGTYVITSRPVRAIAKLLIW